MLWAQQWRNCVARRLFNLKTIKNSANAVRTSSNEPKYENLRILRFCVCVETKIGPSRFVEDRSKIFDSIPRQPAESAEPKVESVEEQKVDGDFGPETASHLMAWLFLEGQKTSCR
jgi:hypothetical protein